MPTTRPGFLAIEDITVSATREGLNEVQVLLERFWHLVDRVCVHPPDGAWRSQFDIAVWEKGLPLPSARPDLIRSTLARFLPQSAGSQIYARFYGLQSYDIIPGYRTGITKPNLNGW